MHLFKAYLRNCMKHSRRHQTACGNISTNFQDEFTVKKISKFVS